MASCHAFDRMAYIKQQTEHSFLERLSREEAEKAEESLKCFDKNTMLLRMKSTVPSTLFLLDDKLSNGAWHIKPPRSIKYGELAFFAARAEATSRYPNVMP